MHARQKVRGSSATYISELVLQPLKIVHSSTKIFRKDSKEKLNKEPKNTNKDPGKMFQSMVWKEKMGNTEEPGREEKI